MEATINYKRINKFTSFLLLFFMIFSLISMDNNAMAGETMIYPLKEISKLDCRYQDFDDLSTSCKQKLPILKTKDYTKYIKLDWWYNNYTRIYTVLWGWSYKYWWDVWNWWHIWTDIATSKWTPVYSIYDWKVTIAKTLVWLWKSVSIEHTINWKTVVSNYSHLSEINVSKWQKVKVWRKIWEVWSTWNSTWNHLHFQIDLDTAFHPYYYDYKTCPYSYSKIANDWVCFDDLKKNTIDPLLFLETSWAVLNNIKVETISRKEFETKDTSSNSKVDLSIFDRTVYTWYSTSDIKEVQSIFKDLWEYRWLINWRYESIEETIIDYQIKTNVIENRNSAWAWWFWPKTRQQTKSDYDKYLANWWKRTITTNSSSTLVVKSSIKTQNISKTWLLSRDEIEAREVEEFTKSHKIGLSLKKVWWNIKVWETTTLKLEIKNRNWRYFKWNMPSGMTFTIDSTKVRIFPTKLYYFTDWKRDIKLTWLKEWNTTLYVKIWKKVIKTFKIRVYSDKSKTTPKTWVVYTNKTIVLSDEKTWIILFRDNEWKKLINHQFEWNYKLKTSEWVQVCIKRGNIKNIRKIYKSSCSDYKNEIDFTYSDTVWWLLLFDYKATWKNAKIELISNTKNQTLSKKILIVQNPKWIKSNYEYKNEVISMLENWIVEWINKWYFLEERWLMEADAVTWIENTLEKINTWVLNIDDRVKIDKNLTTLRKKKVSKYKSITREEFLDLAYTYLVIENNTWLNTISYRDLEDNGNLKANAIFDKENTWKDKFWENYYRPNVKITRWEAAYLLSTLLERNRSVYLTSR